MDENAQNMMNMIQEQLKNNPREFKKMKKQMKQWGKEPGAVDKMKNLLQTMGVDTNPNKEHATDPRAALRHKLKLMRDKRTGKKLG